MGPFTEHSVATYRKSLSCKYMYVHCSYLIHIVTHAHLKRYTAQETSRCSVCRHNSFPFICPVHFPTESLTPFPASHWHISPSILMHSFILATICLTPAITTTVIDRYWAGCPFQQIKAGLSWSDPAVTSWVGCWEKGVNKTHQAHTNKTFGVPTQAVSTVVMYHLCHHCGAFS